VEADVDATDANLMPRWEPMRIVRLMPRRTQMLMLMPEVDDKKRMMMVKKRIKGATLCSQSLCESTCPCLVLFHVL